jgi:peptidoglycan/LPS O-acetylase OafA/YrhL
LRGIAALLVVFYHVRHLIIDILPPPIYKVVSSSYLAVDFFFVLSGFILCWKYHNSFSTGSINNNFLLFIKKRIIRIYPLHLIIFLSYLSIPFLLFITDRPIDDRYPLNMIIPHLFLIQDWGFFSEIGWNIPSWSISAEFLAYLTFPLVSIFIHKMPKYISICVLFILYFSLISLFYKFDADSIGEYISALGWLRCLTGFYFGTCVFFVIQLKIRSKYIIIAIATCFVTTCIFTEIPNYFYINILFALSLLITIEYKKISVLLLDNRILHYLGNISYSIYMVHYFVRDFMVMIFLDNNGKASLLWLMVYIFLTLLISHITYKLIEIRLKNWLLNRVVNVTN